MAVVQLAGELQASIDPHADALAQQFFGANRRPELASLLRSMRDLVQAVLHPRRGGSPGAGGKWAVVHLSARPHAYVQTACYVAGVERSRLTGCRVELTMRAGRQ